MKKKKKEKKQKEKSKKENKRNSIEGKGKKEQFDRGHKLRERIHHLVVILSFSVICAKCRTELPSS